MSEETVNEGAKAPEKKVVKRQPARKIAAPRQAAPEKTAAVQQARPDRSVSPHKKRVPLGSRNRLTFENMDPNFYYRVINDTDDRIDRALEAGYEFVQGKARLGDHQAGDDSPVGSGVKKAVGGGVTGFLMRQPLEFHKEDQQVKMDRIDELEASTKPDASNGQYGQGLIKN